MIVIVSDYKIKIYEYRKNHIYLNFPISRTLNKDFHINFVYAFKEGDKIVVMYVHPYTHSVWPYPAVGGIEILEVDIKEVQEKLSEDEF